MVFTPGLVLQLATAADSAVSRALGNGAPIMTSVPRTEPGLVAAVHLGAIPEIAAAWSLPLASRGMHVKLTGVFCHQSPMVTYHVGGRHHRCELADLLVVVDNRTRYCNGRRAALIQAKMASKAETVDVKKGSGWTQLALYQGWPLFDFELATYGLKSVNLTLGSDSHCSGTYGIIDRHWHRSRAPRWSQHPANPTPKKTRGYPELGCFLARMLAGHAGFGRAVDASVNPTWTKVVDALMRETFRKTFRHSSTLGKTAPRSVSALAFTPNGPASFSVSGGTGGPPEGAFSLIEEGPTGISTLLLEVAEGEIPDQVEW